ECSTWAHRGRIYRRRVVHARNEARLSELADDAARRSWWAFVNAPAERDNALVEAALRNASLVVIPLTPNQNDLYRTEETITATRAAGKPFLLVINRARPRVLGR